ncbi:MAG: helix-turn-helix domain-containing protein [Actinomycetota bacterium]
MLRSRPPRDRRLAAHVERLWWSEVDDVAEAETILPTGRAQLIVDLRGERADATVLQGPRSTPSEIDPAVQRRAVGVALRSGGTAAFVEVPACEVADRFVALDDVWSTTAQLREDLVGSDGPEEAFDRLERELVERLAPPADDLLPAAAAALAGGRPVREVADAIGLDRRRFATRFAARYGFGPKRYARLRRFERALRVLRSDGPDPLAVVAADLGYADQAHLSREVREFAGVTPAELRRVPAGAPTHLRRGGDSFKTSPHVEPTMGA